MRAPRLICLLLPACASIASAAEVTPALPAQSVAYEVAADGFDDPAWAQAPVIGGVTQQEPEEGKPSTLGIDCRVVVTPKALLLRFRMTEPQQEIVAHELRRDPSVLSDDQIALVLDTWHDRRNAYYFATNPNGVRVDGLITEQAEPSLDWDTIWDVHVRRTAEGWEAIFRIPFSSLAFPGDSDGVWGFNFERDAKRRNEQARWAGWKRPWHLYQVSHAGDLTALPDMPARQLRQVSPYAAAALDQRQSPPDTDLLGKAGLDFRYGVSSSIEADLTVNTDFAETEVDAQQFNFGRTSLFFPEKRSFFLQRSQVFLFGDKDTTIPFFSRRIGLSDGGEPIPIDVGLKLTGRAGQTEFGALAVQTRAASGEPRSDFFVGRVKQDVGHSTYLGGLFTDVERDGGPGPHHSLTWGVDLQSNPLPEWRLSTYYVATEAPGATGKNAAWSVDLFYTGENFRGELQRAVYPDAYDPQIGYVAQSGISFWFASLGGTVRPRILGLQDVSLDVFTFPKDNEDGTPNERVVTGRLLANWLNGAFLSGLWQDFDENLTERLDLSGHATIPVGRYRFARGQVSAGTDPSRDWIFSASVALGGYYDGYRDAYGAEMDWKPSSHVSVSLLEQYNVVRLPGSAFALSLLSARVDWNASVRLLTSVIIQSNNLDRLTSIQAIVRWLIDPATDIFAVLNQQRGAGFENPGTRVTLKCRKAFDF